MRSGELPAVSLKASMVRSLRTFPLLDGYRGRPKADVGAFEDTVMVLASGAVVVDARIRVEAVTPWPPIGALRP